MSKTHILIDAAHEEETRVAVTTDGQLDNLDFETKSSEQHKGNIYLAKVIRIEPSLQAAFIEYIDPEVGNHRHGFLPFNEIHPDYFRIPVADREKLMREQEEFESSVQEQDDSSEENSPDLDESESSYQSEEFNFSEPANQLPQSTPGFTSDLDSNIYSPALRFDEPVLSSSTLDNLFSDTTQDPGQAEIQTSSLEIDHFSDTLLSAPDPQKTSQLSDLFQADILDSSSDALRDPLASDHQAPLNPSNFGQENSITPASHTPGAPAVRSKQRQKRNARHFSLHRRYRIQEVITRGQVILIQVVKEERQNKGAALTTYLSIPGRYCVLMPNNNKGSGVSRKITDMQERRQLKDMVEQIGVPKGMAVIIRTAGIGKSQAEMKKDLDYLFRLWDEIREKTLVSTAPSLIYEEANLIKRSIRDLYHKDIQQIMVEGEEGFKIAKDFMRMMMPSHTRKVMQYTDTNVPLFSKFRIENQIEEIYNPVVKLNSGGYLVINTTEALVSIDINSGKSTKERNIKETAFKTNLEAAREIPRQLRIRDLAGLIVIDFIDMDESRHINAVERAFRESIRQDRARVQIGHISQFGLLELSRQRLRPNIFEIHYSKCPHCQGTGHMRTVDSTTLSVMRQIQQLLITDNRVSKVQISVPSEVALYMLNHKRDQISQLETQFECEIHLNIKTLHNGTPFDIQILESSKQPARNKSKKQNEQRGQRGARVSASAQPVQSPDTPTASESSAPHIGEEENIEIKADEAIMTNDQKSGQNRRRSRHLNRRNKREGQKYNEVTHTEGAPTQSSTETIAYSEAPPIAAQDNTNSDQKRETKGRRNQRRPRGERTESSPSASESDFEGADTVKSQFVDQGNQAAVSHIDSSEKPQHAHMMSESMNGVRASEQAQQSHEEQEQAPTQKKTKSGERKSGWWQKLMS